MSPAAKSEPVQEFFSIGEVCELTGLKPHVLRYWESQFRFLSPAKNRSGNRVYQRREVELIMLVKHLLYDEKYTIEGARQKVDEHRKQGELPGRRAPRSPADARVARAGPARGAQAPRRRSREAVSVAVVIPALDAERTVGAVAAGLRAALPASFIVGVDDGSRDGTRRGCSTGATW